MTTPSLRRLPDARRANKPWLPEDDDDVASGLVLLGPDGRPRCRLHGAMNRVHPVERFYRCSEHRCGVGAELIYQPAPSLEEA